MGLEWWDERSATADAKYPGVTALEAKWGSFRGEGLGLGTLFRWAQEHGWQEVPPIHENVNGAPALPPQFANHENVIRFEVDKSGRPKSTCRNARAAILSFGLQCSHDLFHRRMIVGGQVIGEYAGEISDDAAQMLRVLIGQRFNFDPGQQNAYDAMVQECLQHPFDPVCDYLEAVEWDRTPRL